MSDTTTVLPGPGWAVHGIDRGHATFPAAPPVSLLGAVLTSQQRDALDAYSAVLADLAASRAVEHELRTTIAAAVSDDQTAAADAYRQRLGTAPGSARWQHESDLDQQCRYTAAIVDVAYHTLRQLCSLLVADRRRLLTDSWIALAESTKRTPDSVRPHVERVVWALDVHRQPAVPHSAVLAALDALPFRDWQQPLDELLDDLGQQVAAALADDEAA